MRRFRWLAGGVLGAVAAVLVGFRVERGHGSSLPEWLFDMESYSHMDLSTPFSAPYWAAAGFIIGALWIVVRDRD